MTGTLHGPPMPLPRRRVRHLSAAGDDPIVEGLRQTAGIEPPDPERRRERDELIARANAKAEAEQIPWISAVKELLEEAGIDVDAEIARIDSPVRVAHARYRADIKEAYKLAERGHAGVDNRAELNGQILQTMVREDVDYMTALDMIVPAAPEGKPVGDGVDDRSGLDRRVQAFMAETGETDYSAALDAVLAREE